MNSIGVRNIFSPRASRIIRALLTNPKREWSVLGLSKETKVGYGHAYRVIETLLKMGLCRRTGTNRIVVANPAELLTRWAGYYDFVLITKVIAYYSPYRDIDDFISKLASISRKGLKYALTLHAGVALVAPYVRPTNVHLYVQDEKMDKFEDLLDLQLTEVGGNVFLIVSYDEGVLYGLQRVRDVLVVSNVQLYVDLYNYPGRGREAAEYLRKKLIGF